MSIFKRKPATESVFDRIPQATQDSLIEDITAVCRRLRRWGAYNYDGHGHEMAKEFFSTLRAASFKLMPLLAGGASEDEAMASLTSVRASVKSKFLSRAIDAIVTSFDGKGV